VSTSIIWMRYAMSGRVHSDAQIILSGL